MHCVRAGQFTTAPPHTMNDCKLGRWGARLSIQRVIIINTRATPLRSALSAAVNAVDNGETKTRTTINLDNRLCDYRLTSVTITLWTKYKIKKVKILSRDCVKTTQCPVTLITLITDGSGIAFILVRTKIRSRMHFIHLQSVASTQRRTGPKQINVNQATKPLHVNQLAMTTSLE